MLIRTGASTVERIFFLLSLLAVFAFFSSMLRSSPFSDDGYDPYYHMGMVKVIAERGVTYHENWLANNIFENAYSNTLLGFHVLGAALWRLVPELAIFSVSRMVIIGLCLAVFAAFFLLSKGTSPLFTVAVILLLLGTPAVVFRMDVFRPQLLGYLFFFMSMFSLIRRRYGLLFISLFSHMLSHTSFPFGIAMALIYVVLKRDTKVLYVIIAAAIAFFVFHPDAQSIVIRQKMQVLDIPFGNVQKGAEWMPATTKSFAEEAGALLFILFLEFVYILRKGYAIDDSLTLKISALPMLFYAASQHGRFHCDLLLMLAVVCCGLYAFFKGFFGGREALAPAALALGSLLLLCLMMPAYLSQINDTAEVFRLNTSRWISENSRGAVIINDWDAFPVLFYGNTYDYTYAAGLDPIYLYAGNPQAYAYYEEALHGTIDIATRYRLIKDFFKADFVVIDSPQFSMEENQYFDHVLTGFHTVLQLK